MWLERTKNVALVAILVVALEIIAIVVVFSGPLLAHEAPPAVVNVTALEVDQLELIVDVDPRRFLAAAIGADHQDLEPLSRAEAISRLLDKPGVVEKSVLLTGQGGPLPSVFKGVSDEEKFVFSVAGVDRHGEVQMTVSDLLGPALIRVLDPSTGDALHTSFATPGSGVMVDLNRFSDRRSTRVVLEYLVAGFDHIVPKGLDHILFVIGLFLLSPALRPIFVQISLFTAAHTATLALASTGLISVPAAVIEPLIALSIVFIAIENLFRTSLSYWRPWVVFGFGLLHGLGFAGVLAEFGLPAEQFALALAAFNIGVEAGQIAVLALCFLVAGLFFNKTWYRSAISVPASVIVAGIGFFWFVERLGEAAT